MTEEETEAVGWEELSPDFSSGRSDSRDPAHNCRTYTHERVRIRVSVHTHVRVCEACTHTYVHTEDKGTKSQGLKGSAADRTATKNRSLIPVGLLWSLPIRSRIKQIIKG